MMIARKKPNFNGLYDKAKALEKKLKNPSGKLLEQYKALGTEPGNIGNLLQDNRLSPAQKAELAHSLEGYRGSEPEMPKHKAPKLGRTRGRRRMI